MSSLPSTSASYLPADNQNNSVHLADFSTTPRVLLLSLMSLVVGAISAGIAWVLPPIRPFVAELLGLPAGWLVRTIVVVGHPTVEARAPKLGAEKARLPRAEVVFEERWPEG